jgi:hypothetical protein
MAKKSGKSRSKRAAAKIPAKKPSAQGVAAGKKTAAKKPPASPKPAKPPVKLPNAWRLARMAAATLWRHKRLFIGITVIYGLLNLLLVQGLANTTDASSLKGQLNQVFTGHLGGLTSGFSIFMIMLGSAGSGSSPTAGGYQSVLVLITSLAVIWALRQISAGTAFRLRDAYYRGMYPLIPFILVLLVIGLQLIPLFIGSTLYVIVTTNSISVYLVEKLFWILVFAVLALWSLYMLSSSLLALYIVTLPDMTPRRALRSAKELSRHRRWSILRKILCLPIMLVIVAAIIMVPIIIVLTPLARWIFFLLTIGSLAAIHTYMYTLYRELLNE